MESNEYQNYTYSSPFFIKRWLHKKRFNDVVKMLNLSAKDALLDYGCGDGYFLEICSRFETIPANNLYGYDPAENMYKQAIEKLKGKEIAITKSIKDLNNKKFTKIVCLETCEHLTGENLTELLKNINNLLANNGEAIITVPIEIGIPALFKNSFRFLKNYHYDNLNLKNYVNSILGRPIERNINQKMEGVNYIYSHIGFDHRKFEKILTDYFEIESIRYSPINLFGSILNNAVFYKCAKK